MDTRMDGEFFRRQKEYADWRYPVLKCNCSNFKYAVHLVHETWYCESCFSKRKREITRLFNKMLGG
jgi:hypothetical protein